MSRKELYIRSQQNRRMYRGRLRMRLFNALPTEVERDLMMRLSRAS